MPTLPLSGGNPSMTLLRNVCAGASFEGRSFCPCPLDENQLGKLGHALFRVGDQLDQQIHGSGADDFEGTSSRVYGRN